MPPVYLTEHDIEQLLDMRQTLEVVEQAFVQLAAGAVDNVPRTRAKAPGFVLHSMSAAAEYLGVAGWKHYTTTRQGAKFLTGLFEIGSGELLALIEANRLGQLRTGAVTGVAIRHLAQQNADTVGLFGSGWQAESQLEAAALARPLKKALVFSCSADKRARFAREMTQRLGLEVVPVQQPRQAVENLPIIITATTAKEPVFDGAWLADGALVCAVGSNWLHKAEIDIQTIGAAASVVCDEVKCCQNEAGDLAAAASAGVFQWSDAVNLAEVVAGKYSARQTDADRIVFKSVGMAIEDVALGAKALELARERNIGRSLEI